MNFLNNILIKRERRLERKRENDAIVAERKRENDAIVARLIDLTKTGELVWQYCTHTITRARHNDETLAIYNGFGKELWMGSGAGRSTILLDRDHKELFSVVTAQLDRANKQKSTRQRLLG